ncbi:MAG: hypothetical protein GY789_30210 [Hyphomicrobiales bacterium]|nr:hypothetical protein [Hyphomicrobiales bacterium]
MRNTLVHSLILLMLLLTVQNSWANEQLARCMAEKGWIMYGSFTCSACRAQRKAFGEAFSHITEIECNPHIAGNQVERCLDRKIRRTPTWLLEKDGVEIGRIENYQLLEDLVALTGCDG